MVLEVGVDLRLVVVVGAQQTSIGVAQVTQDELRAGDGGGGVACLIECCAGLGERGDRQRVPGGQALVVQPWSGAAFADLEQPGAYPGPRCIVGTLAAASSSTFNPGAGW